MNYKERINQTVMNLLSSYSVSEDKEAEVKGYKFLGAMYDSEGKEVHVWELTELNKFIKSKAK